MSTATSWLCPLRNFQTCAAAIPAAAMLACAAAATRNDDGSCGSAPVSVTASSAADSPPADVQRSARISRGVCMEFLHFRDSSYAGLTRVSILLQKEMDGRVKPGHDTSGTLSVHCEERSDEAAFLHLTIEDCFASLAMTVGSNENPLTVAGCGRCGDGGSSGPDCPGARGGHH